MQSAKYSTDRAFFDGPHNDSEGDLLLATHGWWPWLLMYAAIIAIVGYGIYLFVKRRGAAN